MELHPFFCWIQLTYRGSCFPSSESLLNDHRQVVHSLLSFLLQVKQLSTWNNKWKWCLTNESGKVAKNHGRLSKNTLESHCPKRLGVKRGKHGKTKGTKVFAFDFRITRALSSSKHIALFSCTQSMKISTSGTILLVSLTYIQRKLSVQLVTPRKRNVQAITLWRLLFITRSKRPEDWFVQQLQWRTSSNISISSAFLKNTKSFITCLVKRFKI